MADEQISQYPTAPPPPPITDETTRTTSSSTTSLESSGKETTSHTSTSRSTGTASTTSPGVSPTSSPPREDPPPLYQHFDPQKLSYTTNIEWDQLSGLPFQELCQPSGDCAKECRDSARLFEGRQSDVIEHNGMSITLFEICSNLGALSLYDASVEAVSASASISDRTLLQISADIGGCLASSCETSRKPWECSESCSVAKIYGGTVGTHNSPMTWHCLSFLCSSTCGMPYMNADVMGIGVMTSYVVQTALITICAIYVLALAILPSATLAKYSRLSHQTESDTLTTQKESNFVVSTRSFLVAQCFLGIALQIAVLVSRPWATDPLNAIGFLFVAITGFLPPVFTLLLLHSRRHKSWFTYTLTLLSWVLATANFFALFVQFSSRSHVDDVSESALKGLKTMEACSGGSAFALCSLVTGQNPLRYAGRFFTYDGSNAFPNFKSSPFIWVCSLLMLIAVTISQVHRPRQTQSPMAGNHSKGGFASNDSSRLHRGPSHCIGLLVAFTAFVFGTIYYQAGILRQLDLMDVLEWNGWSFGQVAAVTIWVPVVVEYAYNPVGSWGR